ncbi:MAG: dipeptide/oligopeptide/nickel ABC transporter permease/ATP-binding protein [Chloroflexota bacterium]|nr:dipeptide/oligopeptide/nickel ABC transporter permease/ATP-binding protein [Chloroflexota bacterium]
MSNAPAYTEVQARSYLAFWRTPFFRAFLSSPSGFLALFLTGMLLATALLAPLVLTREEIYQRNVRRRLEGPSADHVLGTDNLGRDILKRTLYATPLTLQLALSAAGMAIVIGFAAGAATAYLPGRLRNMGVRLLEIMLAFPGILIAIMLVAVVGTSAEGAVLAIGIAFSPSLARVAYTLASGVAGLDYISSARVLGLSSRRIVFRYIIPNIAETLIVVSFNATASALVAVSSLSFLGLGVQGTQFDWGRLITEGVLRLYQVPLLALAPALAIGITGLTLGYLGEALARGLNPALWTQTAAIQSRTWLQRYFSSEYMLLTGATLLLVAFYFLPWFSPDALDPNRTLVTGAKILAGDTNLAAIATGSQVAMLLLRTGAWIALLLGLLSYFFLRYRRFCAYLGLICGLCAGSYFLSFLLADSASLGTALASAQLGFYLGVGATILLILQVVSDKSRQTRGSPDDIPAPSQASAVEAPVSQAQPLLQARGLTVRFELESGSISPVNDINIDLAEGEIVGVVGESGSGKSMTALALAQLVPHPGVVSAHYVRLRGEDITRMSAGQLRYFLGSEMAMIFQDPMSSLNPALKIGTQLTEATRVHRRVSGKALRKMALERMADVHISAAETRLKQYPHEFSGGMRQRAMIAMGLMNSPSLIIADEPTTALDVTIQAQIIDVLREINQEQGTTVLLISHDVGVIIEICSRVLVMYAGRIVEDVQITELMTADKHPYTEALIAAVPAFDSDRDEPLASIPGRPPDLDNLPSGCAFAPRCPYVFERCRQEVPALLHVDDNHRIACFLRTEALEDAQA